MIKRKKELRAIVENNRFLEWIEFHELRNENLPPVQIYMFNPLHEAEAEVELYLKESHAYPAPLLKEVSYIMEEAVAS